MQGFGALLKSWRNRRRMSQMTLALESDVSTRHLSYLETGKAMPSRDMVLRLADIRIELFFPADAESEHLMARAQA